MLIIDFCYINEPRVPFLWENVSRVCFILSKSQTNRHDISTQYEDESIGPNEFQSNFPIIKKDIDLLKIKHTDSIKAYKGEWQERTNDFGFNNFPFYRPPKFTNQKASSLKIGTTNNAVKKFLISYVLRAKNLR